MSSDRGAGATKVGGAPTFERDVVPLLRGRCQPCHFPGGSMHAKLPFDDEKTVRRLGEKLFTRIKAEEDRAILRAFFATGG